MKTSKNLKLIAVTCCLSLAAIGACSLANSGSSIFKFGVNAEEQTYKLTIDKMSTRANNKVTATSALGNTVDFSYSRFDTRPGDTDYNNCICFYALQNGLGGYITNDTAIYGVKTINIYGYSTSNPTPSTLSTGSFNIYYGYEQIVVDPTNTAKVAITNGTYSFADGLEPSYIAIECTNTFDYCVSKVEIIHKCAPVSGTIDSHTGPAYKYEYVGKEFTTQGGEKVAYNVTEQAPWVHANGLDVSSNFESAYGNSTYNAETQTWATTSNDHLYFKPGTASSFAEAATRKIVSATLTMTMTATSAWGGSNADLYFGVNDKTSRMFNGNILKGSQSWENNAAVIGVYDATTGESLYGKSIVGKKVTIDFDANGVTNITYVMFGTSLANVNIVIDDISFKSTACGHPEYEEVTRDSAYQYYGQGTSSVCPVCGESLKTRENLTVAAPWLRLNPNTPGSDCTLTSNGNNSYTSTAIGWNNSVYYTLPDDLEGRTQLAVTFKAPETWDLYFYIGGDSSTAQIVTASSKINYALNPLVSEVLGPDNNSLNYNASTYSIDAKVGTNLTTIIYDLSKATWTTAGASVRLCLYAVGTYTAYVDLRKPCDHSNTEEFSSGINCGTRCADCGRLVSSLIDGVDKTTPAGKDSYFSYETGVTFDGRKDCLKTRTTAYTNNNDMGWAVNYKVRFLNLVKNARAANKPLIKLNFYISASATDNMRLAWGVQTNDNLNYSGAQADHWNYAQTVFVGTNDVASNSSISTEANPGVESRAPANQWLVLTVDVSGDAFADATNFFISANIDSSSTHDRYPIETYISNIYCVAKA